MPTNTLTQTIAATPAEVFATISDLRTFPDWNPTIKASRRLNDGPIGEGTRFEMTIKGFGNQQLTLRRFKQDQQVDLVPTSKMFSGGHLFILTETDGGTRIDHELVTNPKGIFKIMSPLMGRISKKNLADTAAALQKTPRIPIKPTTQNGPQRHSSRARHHRAGGAC